VSIFRDPVAPEPAVVVRIVRLGSDRLAGEGTRIGTVRRPPRGIPKAEFAARNYYDVWLPNLAPSVATMQSGQRAATEKQWAAFVRKYRSEMGRPDAARVIALLATLSRDSDFSVGCYCETEDRCHRGVLRALLHEQGARLEDDHASSASKN
jgi:uncharacterized protein YeaO (DUF488 family)